eukprot:761745_1
MKVLAALVALVLYITCTDSKMSKFSKKRKMTKKSHKHRMETSKFWMHKHKHHAHIKKGPKQFIGRTAFTPFINSYKRHHHHAKQFNRIGVYFDSSGLIDLLEDVPNDTVANTMWSLRNRTTGEITRPCCGHEIVMDYDFDGPHDDHQKFNHLLLNWNPEGHAPLGIYNVPHFDFHFYFINSTERESLGIDGAKYEDEACVVNGVAEFVNCDDYAR